MMYNWMNHTICHGDMQEEAHIEGYYAQDNTLFFTYTLRLLKCLKSMGKIKQTLHGYSFGCFKVYLLFIIARTWKQPRCPSADEWIRKLGYIYTMEYYSAIKKNTCESLLMRWMKLAPIIQSEVSQKEKHQCSILMQIYGI